MMTKLNSAILAATLFATGVAYADAPRLPGDQHEPALFVDERAIDVQLASADGGYHPSASFLIYGAKRESDGFRLEWKQGGKLLGTQKCSLALNDGAPYAHATCEDSAIGVLKAAGAVTVDVIYVDDTNDKQYLVRTLGLSITKWMMGGTTPNFAVAPDDAFGIALYSPFQKRDSAPVEPTFSFWTTAVLTGKQMVRCKVDGKAIDDFEVSVADRAGAVEVDDLPKSGARITYKYQHGDLRFDNLLVGMRTDKASPKRYLGETPGAWVCDLRVEGKVVRTLSFAVDAKGAVQPDEIATGKKMFKLPPDVLPIAIAIPKGVDLHLRPAAMKATVNFGLPWPDHPNAKKWQAAFPPQAGPDVK